MTKTPEQMAEEYIRYDNESAYWTKHAFFAGYQAAQQWISVKERLPELNVDVLIYVNFTVHSVTFKHCSVALFDGTCWDDDGWYSRNSVTYWMPLPKPPEE